MNGWDYFVKSYPNNNIVQVCMAIYKREVIENANLIFPEGVFFEDNYFTFAFLDVTKKVEHISEKLYQRRYRSNSITMSDYSERKFIDYLKVCLMIWEIINGKDVQGINGKEKFLIKFISDYCYCVFTNYQKCLNERIDLCKGTYELFYNMMEQYINMVNRLYNGILDLDIPLQNRLVRNYFNIWKYGKEKKVSLEVLTKARERRRKAYINLFSKIPFDQEKLNIGIYGIGNHTKGLLAVYEKLIGNIVCKLVFICTDDNNKIYRDRPVLNYKTIKNKIDLIIISSFLYEREMENNVRKVDKEIPIIKFYDTYDEDIFSGYQVIFENNGF